MKGNCTITFSGLNVNRLLDKLSSVGVKLYCIDKCGKTCKISVLPGQCKQVVALLRERCYNIEKIEYTGGFAVWRFVKAHCLIVVLALILVVAVAFASNVCAKIEVVGDYAESEVLAAMTELGVCRGARMSKLQVDDLENALSNKLDAMYAVINRKGSVLYVNAVKRKEVAPPIDVHKRRDIVSSACGKVISMYCEQGAPLVKVGDCVNVGDVLIVGERRFNDGTSEDVYALGQITVEVSAVGFAEFDGFAYEFQPTGNVFKAVNVVLFGKPYGKTCDFEFFEKEIQTSFLQPLNLEIQSVAYHELRRVKTPADIERCKDELTQKALDAAGQNCNFEVLKQTVNVQTNGVEVILTGEAVIR